MGRKIHILQNVYVSFIIMALLLLGSSKIIAQTANVDSLFKAILDHNQKGMELIKKGDKTGGNKEFTRSVEAYDDYGYWTADKRDSTIKIFESLEKNNSKSPVFAYIMGSMTSITKRDEAGQVRAEEYMKKAIEIEPGFGKGYSYLGRLALAKNKDKEALSYYQKSFECDSSILSNYYRISSLFEKEKNYSEAEKWINKLIKMDSSDSYSISAMIKMAGKKSTFKEKYNLFLKVIRLSKNDEKQYPVQSTLIFLSKEAPDSALAFCKRLLKSDLGKIRSFKQMALQNIYQILLRIDKKSIPAFAEENYNLDNPRLLADFGKYFSDSLKNKELSLNYYLKAYEITTPESVENTIASGGGSTFKEFLANTAKSYKEGPMAAAVGKSYYELKKYDNAEKYLRESIAENEKDRSNFPHLYLGYTLAENGKKEEAVQWLARGLAMKSNPEGEKKLKELIADLKLTKSYDDLVREERMKQAQPAKDFTLADLNGNIVQLSKLKGKVVMLDFWGTWCGPCVSELPQLVKLYEKYKNNPNVVFFGVDINEQPAVIKKFMNEKNYSFNVLIADGTTVQKDYGVTAVPTKFIIDKNGKTQFKHIGANPKEDVIESISKEIDELLRINN